MCGDHERYERELFLDLVSLYSHEEEFLVVDIMLL
jgi:hypothetical protein